MDTYAGYMRGNIRLAHTRLRFAIDAGNGAGGPLRSPPCTAVGLVAHRAVLRHGRRVSRTTIPIRRCPRTSRSWSSA